MTQESHDEQMTALLSLAAAGQFDDLEAAWMEAIEDQAFGADAATSVLEALAEQDATKPLESLAWLLISTWMETGRAADACIAIRRAADLLPASGVLREEISGLYRQACAQADGIDTLVAMTLGRNDLPLPTAVARLETLLALPPGAFVIDPRRRHPGCVLGVDPERQVLKVSFGKSERGYDAVSIANVEAGDPGDFRALLAFSPDRLTALAEDDPAELARLVLKTNGPEMKFRDFRAALEPVISAKAWSKWWSKARDRVRRSPHLEVSGGTQPTLTLRARPRSFEDRARETFDEAETPAARLAFALAYAGETGHDPEAEAQVLAHFAEALARRLEAGAPAEPTEILGTLAVLAEMHRRHPDVVERTETDFRTLAPEADLVAAIASFPDAGLARCVLAHVRETLPDAWPQVSAEALPACQPDVCASLAAALSEAGHDDMLAQAAAEIMRRPDDCRAAIFWLWTVVTADHFGGAFADMDRTSLTIRFLLAADKIGQDARDDRSLRPLVAEIRSAVGTRGGGPLRAVLEASDDAQAKDIRAAVERNRALTDAIRSRVLDLVRKIHPSHFATPTLEPWEDEAVIYTTAQALHKQEEAYGHLVTIQIAANAQAIGDAAELGDVSDNAEFMAALEERDRLAERAGRMQADIGKAKILMASLAAGNTVTVGSAVRARRLPDGEEQTLRFLGPWDADVENHVYFYRAPLSLAFMGKKAGDVVTYGEGTKEQRWEILDVGPGL
ncbi:MAG TPA: GreA/GreB family elongation factor [Phycisphaerae bacterium]|nr:GreA/GreB family elongation factor [Phycisphaerae bacterium]